MKSNNTLDNKYNIIKLLSQGGFSNVYLVNNANDNIQYAARIRKDIQKEEDKEYNFEHELKMTTIASGLNNPNIISLIGSGVGTLTLDEKVTNNVNYMILEYCPKEDLFNYIYEGRFEERQAKYIFKKILSGVEALHKAGYCHRNLKIQNLLLDKNFNPKISNFLFATQFQQNNEPIKLKGAVGTLHYCSPQVIANQTYNGEKADIFNLGVILFNLVTGNFGFNKAHKNDLYYKYIANGMINEYWDRLPEKIKNINYSKEFKDLYISMVSFNENNRPNIAQVLSHHWFDEINNLDKEQFKQLESEVMNEFETREVKIEQKKIFYNNRDNNRDVKITSL